MTAWDQTCGPQGIAPNVQGRRRCLELHFPGHRSNDAMVGRTCSDFATRGIEHGCTGGFIGFSDIAGTRRSDAYGALVFLARQTFVDPQRVAAVGFSQGGWVTLLVAEANSFELFVRLSNLVFRACAGP
jgi:dienelactone hydrolase